VCDMDAFSTALSRITTEDVFYALIQKLSYVREGQVSIIRAIVAYHICGVKWVTITMLSELLGSSIGPTMHLLGDKGILVLRDSSSTPFAYRLSDELCAILKLNEKSLNIGNADVFNHPINSEVKNENANINRGL